MAKYYDLNIPGFEVQRRLDLASHNVLAFDGILDMPVAASDELITSAESYQILYAPNGGRGEMLMSIGGTYYRNFRLQSAGKTYLDSSWYNEDGQIRKDRLFLNGAARDIYAYAAGSFGKVERDGVDGQDGITPHIDPTTKHWMLGDEDTGIVAEGQDGEDGVDGKSAFDIWLENGHSGNISDFLAWMKDTSSMIGPKFASTTADCLMVNDTPTLYFVPNGTTFNVYLADSGGQGVNAHSLATGVPGDITNYAGIYDISQDKAVNGVPATYGSLSDALGAITEDSKRKGGMTIKYIDSTSSKYVQYRYLSTSVDSTEFLNENNWSKSIGEDDITLKSTVTINLFNIEYSGFFIITNPIKFVRLVNFNSKLIPVSPHKKYRMVVKREPIERSHFYAFLAASPVDESTPVFAGDTGLETNDKLEGGDITVVAPSNAIWLYVSCINNSVDQEPSLIQEIDEFGTVTECLSNIDEKPTKDSTNLVRSGAVAEAIEESAEKVKSEIESNSVMEEIILLQKGFVLTNAGEIGDTLSISIVENASTADWYSGIVNVRAGERFKLSGYAGNTYRIYAVVDGNNEILDVSEGLGTTYDNEIITMPVGAKKLIVNINGASGFSSLYRIRNSSSLTKVYGYERSYCDITHQLTFERKTINDNAISDSTVNAMAKLPNNGVIEVKMNRPIGKFKVYRKTNGTYTELTEDWSNYQHRYVGDYVSDYYVIVANQNDATLIIDDAVTIIKAYIINDKGTTFEMPNAEILYGKNVAFIGDSIVQGRFCKLGNSVNMCMAMPYSNLISCIINQIQPKNYGIGGALVYNNDWKSLYLNCVKVTGFDIVFVAAGTNDNGNNVIVSNFTSAFSYVIDTLKASNTEVIVVTPVPRTSGGNNLYKYVNTEKTIALEKGCKIIDLFSLLNTEVFKSTLGDGLHPNEIGHKMIADAIIKNV